MWTCVTKKLRMSPSSYPIFRSPAASRSLADTSAIPASMRSTPPSSAIA